MPCFSTHTPVSHQGDESTIVLWSASLPVLVLSIDYDATTIELGISSSDGGEPTFAQVQMIDGATQWASPDPVDAGLQNHHIGTGMWQVCSAGVGTPEIKLIDPQGVYLCVIQASDSGIEVIVHEIQWAERSKSAVVARSELERKGNWPVLMAA